MPTWNPHAPYWIALKAAEKRILQGAWDETKGVTSAAAILGIDRQQFVERCRIVGVVLPVRGRARKLDYLKSLPKRVPG